MKVGVEHEKIENVEERLQRWLGEEGCNVEKLGDEKTTFNLWVTKDGLPSFSVYQPRDKHDVIYVESGVTFSGMEKKLHPVIVDSKHSLSWELKSRLLSSGFAYHIQPPDLQSNKPGGIVFAKTIYYDGLSKDRFLDTIHQTLSTVMVMILTVRRHVDKCTTNSTDKDHSLSYMM